MTSVYSLKTHWPWHRVPFVSSRHRHCRSPQRPERNKKRCQSEYFRPFDENIKKRKHSPRQCRPRRHTSARQIEGFQLLSARRSPPKHKHTDTHTQKMHFILPWWQNHLLAIRHACGFLFQTWYRQLWGPVNIQYFNTETNLCNRTQKIQIFNMNYMNSFTSKAMSASHVVTWV